MVWEGSPAKELLEFLEVGELQVSRGSRVPDRDSAHAKALRRRADF